VALNRRLTRYLVFVAMLSSMTWINLMIIAAFIGGDAAKMVHMAAPPPPTPAPTPSTLRLVLGTSRHAIKGVKYDFSAMTDRVFNQSFGAPAEDLTPHGEAVAVLYAEDFRDQYVGEGKLVTNVSKVHFYADPANTRDVATAQIFLRTFTNNSNADAHQLDISDHLKFDFSEGRPDALREGCTWAGSDVVTRMYGKEGVDTITPFIKDAYGPFLERLDTVLGCCKPTFCASHDLPLNCSLLDTAHTWKGGYWATFDGPWAVYKNLGNLLMTQAVSGMAVADGDLTPDEALDLFSSVTEGYWDSYKQPYNMHNFGGDHLTLILAILEQAGTRRPSNFPDVTNAVDSPFVWLMGHDVNVAFVKTALGLHYRPSGDWRADSSAMFLGGIIFELHEGVGGALWVQVRVQAMSPQELRMLAKMSIAQRDNYLIIPGCASPDSVQCPFDKFVSLLQAQIDRRCVGHDARSYLSYLDNKINADN